MANEITVQASLKVDNGGLELTHKSGVLRFTQTNARGGNPGVVDIGTSEEDVSFGDLAAPGWVYMRNLDTTNYVEWGKKDGSNNMQAIGRLGAGEVSLFKMNASTTLRMKANTAACKVLIAALDG